MTAFVKRRELLLGFAVLPVASHIAVAETSPSRPVRILVATSAAGGTDLVARFIAQWLSERLGQSFFVENRPGGQSRKHKRSPRGSQQATQHDVAQTGIESADQRNRSIEGRHEIVHSASLARRSWRERRRVRRPVAMRPI